MAENVDSSYYTGGDTGIGTYLGQDYNALPFYAITERFGKPVETGNIAQQEGVRLGSGEELIRIMNKDTGQVVYEGRDPNELRAALDTLTAGGNQTQWELQQYSPGSIDPLSGELNAPSQWRTTDSNLKEQSALGMLADYGLPIVMNALIPGSGLLHGALTAAGGSVLSGALQGKPIGSIAKSALLSGIGGGIGGALGGVNAPLDLSPAFEAARGAGGSLISGLGGGIGAGLGGAAGAGLSGLSDDVINVLANTLGSGAALGSAAGGVLGSVAGSGGGYQAQPGDSPMVNVTGVRAPVPISSGAPGLAAGLSGVGPLAIQAAERALAEQAAQQAAQEQADRQPEDTIVVTAPPKPFIPSWALPAAGVAGLAGFGSTLLGPGLTAPTTPSTPSADSVVDSPEITVTAPNTPVTPFVPPIITPTAALTTPRPITGDLAIPATALGGLTAAQALNQPGTPTQPRTLSDYINMVRGGLGVVGGIGSLLGGGGDDGGTLPPGFNANAGTVNYTPLARTQNVTPFDPFTYGQATGERSFFNPYELQYQTNVPATTATPAPAFKDGGEAESVKGIANSPPLSLEKVLEKNKNLPFVQRILYPQQSPVAIDDEDSEGKRVMTHKMEWGEADGNYYAYPRVMEDESGKLKDYKGSAFKEASRRGDILKMQTPEQADWFTKNYKSYWDSIGFVPQKTKSYSDGGEAEFDDSIEGHLASYYSGGGHAGPGPVKGIGSGQEDKIPAWLSDGEYVWSAQDVADLGDGSTNEGVRRLDKMRQMVRKDAGRKDTKSIARPQKGIDSMLKAVGGAA
jgi:hypothetical protein